MTQRLASSLFLVLLAACGGANPGDQPDAAPTGGPDGSGAGSGSGSVTPSIPAPTGTCPTLANGASYIASVATFMHREQPQQFADKLLGHL